MTKISSDGGSKRIGRPSAERRRTREASSSLSSMGDIGPSGGRPKCEKERASSSSRPISSRSTSPAAETEGSSDFDTRSAAMAIGVSGFLSSWATFRAISDQLRIRACSTSLWRARANSSDVDRNASRSCANSLTSA